MLSGALGAAAANPPEALTSLFETRYIIVTEFDA
jgi:hypothetical protein